MMQPETDRVTQRVRGLDSRAVKNTERGDTWITTTERVSHLYSLIYRELDIHKSKPHVTYKEKEDVLKELCLLVQKFSIWAFIFLPWRTQKTMLDSRPIWRQ